MGEVGVQTGLAEWLLACVAEDEQRAKACAEDPLGYGPVLAWRVGGEESIYVDDTNLPVAVGPWGGGIREEHAAHIAAWDPARVLVECDTKRRIIAECKYWYDKVERGEDYPALADRFEVAMSVLRLMAAVYSDRPGYRAEWKPDGR